MKAMTDESRLFQLSKIASLPDGWDFFVLPRLPEKSFYAQDTVHILPKMRTKLITSSNLIVMGAETACRSHLQFIIDAFSKSKLD